MSKPYRCSITRPGVKIIETGGQPELKEWYTQVNVITSFDLKGPGNANNYNQTTKE